MATADIGRDAMVFASRAPSATSVQLFDDCETAAPLWRQLADGGALATPYGRHELIESWYRHVGTRDGRPLIAAAIDAAGAPLFVLPLVVSRCWGLTVARFAGGAHTQLNLGLWRRDCAGTWTPDLLRAALEAIAAQRGIDLFLLHNQPRQWQGIAAPLSLLPHQASPDDVYCAHWPPLTGEAAARVVISTGNRKRLRGKERKLQAIAGYRSFRAASEAETDRLLHTFFAQKRRFFAQRCIRNPFDEAGVAEFLRAACLDGLADGRPVIELHAIEAGGEVLAVIGGTTDGRRFSAMFNSMTDEPDMVRLSPGLVLMFNLIRDCADRGLTSYDHGIGFAPYKVQFCKDVDRLFDSFLGFSERGHLAAVASRLAFAAKRVVKTTTPIWTLACRIRQLRALALPGASAS